MTLKRLGPKPQRGGKTINLKSKEEKTGPNPDSPLSWDRRKGNKGGGLYWAGGGADLPLRWDGSG